jgi:hypothetical protein
MTRLHNEQDRSSKPCLQVANGGPAVLRRHHPPRRPVPLHSLADGFASGSGHLAPSRTLGGAGLCHGTSVSPDDERQRQFVRVVRVAEMWEQSDKVLGFPYQLSESHFRATSGEFKQVGVSSASWHVVCHRVPRLSRAFARSEAGHRTCGSGAARCRGRRYILGKAPTASIFSAPRMFRTPMTAIRI